MNKNQLSQQNSLQTERGATPPAARVLPGLLADREQFARALGQLPGTAPAAVRAGLGLAGRGSQEASRT